MAEAGNALLPLLYPDFYAKMLPIERRQTMANMLMRQGSGDPGTAKFGGLRNAGNMLAGALLGRSSDRQLGELYSGPQSPGIHDTGQVTNDPQPQPDLQGNVQPQASQLNLYPGVSPDTQGPAPNAPQTRTQALGGALLGQTPQPQGGAPQAPQQPQTPQMSLTDGGLPVLPGLSKQSSMMLLLTNPGEYLSAVAKNAAPTDFQKIVGQVYRPGSPQYQAALQAYAQKQTMPDSILQAQYAAGGNQQTAQNYLRQQYLSDWVKQAEAVAPNDPQGQLTYLRQKAAKETEINLRPGGTSLLNGQPVTAPKDGIGTTWGPNGPSNYSIPGYAEANAGIVGKQTAAQQANTIMPIGLGGRTGVPVPGSEIFNAWRGGQYQPLTGSAPASQPGAPGGQPQPQPGGNVPSIGGLPLGTSPADTAAGAKTGDMAATAAEAKATTESLLKSIDDAIAESRGFGGFHMGIGPEKWAQAGQRVGYPEAMTHLNNYNQLVGVGILNGLQNLRGLGRADLPEVNEVVKTYGVDANNDPKVREAGLMNLKTIVQRAAAAKQNAVANMNAPGAVTNTTQQPMGAGGPPQPQFHEGQTATGPGNKQIIFRNGQWVPK